MPRYSAMENLWRQCQPSQGLSTRETATLCGVDRLHVCFCCLVSAFADSLKWAGPSPRRVCSLFLPGSFHRVWDSQDGGEEDSFWDFPVLPGESLCRKDRPPGPWRLGIKGGLGDGWGRRENNWWRGRGLKLLGWNHSPQSNPADCYDFILRVTRWTSLSPCLLKRVVIRCRPQTQLHREALCLLAGKNREHKGNLSFRINPEIDYKAYAIFNSLFYLTWF